MCVKDKQYEWLQDMFSKQQAKVLLLEQGKDLHVKVINDVERAVNALNTRIDCSLQEDLATQEAL